MQTSNAKQSFDSDDPEWVLLSELPFIYFLSDQDRGEEPEFSSLFQTLRELDMSHEGMENITETVTGFAREAWERSKQSRPEFLGRIRIFCQKKMKNDAGSAKRYSRVHTTGGWGYFTIERGEDSPFVSSAIQHYGIDLYLYKEGE